MFNIIKLKTNCFISFFLIILIIIFFPAIFRPDTDKFKIPFNKKLFNDLKAADPEVLFIGNSMLDSRIDRNYYEKLSGKKTYLLTRAGFASSGWYLLLKNFIAASGIQPEIVYIFFRDTFPTDPLFRATDHYIGDFKTNEENIYYNTLLKNMSIMEKVQYYTKKFYPILLYKNNVGQIINNHFYTIAGTFFDLNPKDINDLFEIKNLRPVKDDGENTDIKFNDERFNFKTRLRNSFLPHIIKIAKKNNLKLVFIRIQRRPGNESFSFNQAIQKKYIEDLEENLYMNGFLFHDFTGDKRITLSMYGSGDHINNKSKKKYTKIFYTTLKNVIQDEK